MSGSSNRPKVGFREAPFNITPDPRFIFYSHTHREAFDHILFGIRERKGFILLTGEVGSGKTTLCRAVLEQLEPRFKTALMLASSTLAGRNLGAGDVFSENANSPSSHVRRSRTSRSILSPSTDSSCGSLIIPGRTPRCRGAVRSSCEGVRKRPDTRSRDG